MCKGRGVHFADFILILYIRPCPNFRRRVARGLRCVKEGVHFADIISILINIP